MTAILGLNAYHADSSACLIVDGDIVAAVAEERLGRRIKHYAGFPTEAVQAVLRAGGLTLKDLDYVAVGHDPRSNLLPKAAYALGRPLDSGRAVLTAMGRWRKIGSLADTLRAEVGPGDADGFRIVEVEHHVAHLASSFFCSGFDEAAGFSYDAAGDFVSTMQAHCSGSSIDVLDRIHLPHSLGYFYTALCQFIGFDHFGEEYKVMGLAAYGVPRYLKLMQEIAQPAGNGRFRLNLRYFNGVLGQSHERLASRFGAIVIPPLYSEHLADVLGPPRRRGSEITTRDRDIAASLQQHFEELVLHCLRGLHARVPVDRLVTAGGAALNGVCNARILRDTPFKRSYIHGAAGDDGTAVGAAMYVWNCVHHGRRIPAVENAYLGLPHDDAEIPGMLERRGVSAEHLDTADLVQFAAGELAAGKVVGWYQGRSEWGPRALGNRSILAHPGWPGMKDLINAKIKRRESFRPFAPTILADRVSDYFEQDVPSPFMMHVVKIREDRRDELSAVTHADGTGRLHTVTPTQNPLYYSLIDAFDKLTGTPVLLNTSFNENEPIVETAEQALDCFLRTDLDVLCLGGHIVRKPTREQVPAAEGSAATRAS